MLPIIGEIDAPVIEPNLETLVKLSRDEQLVIVPGATYLVEEPGTLEGVA